ncbi:MAG: PadR family transcriptional regulator [Thermoleophilaceae bacterium]
MQTTRLTPTSYIVLGLLELAGEATPYELKQGVRGTLGNFWSLQHAQLYSEPQRLVEGGYLKERRERSGRRRRHYSLTRSGRQALDEWRSSPTSELSELRDLALLKLFFGADAAELAGAQLDAHRAKLAEYEALRRLDGGDAPRGPWLALESGIAHEREWVRYWEALRDDPKARADG